MCARSLSRRCSPSWRCLLLCPRAAACDYDTAYPDPDNSGNYDLVLTPTSLGSKLREDTGSIRFDYHIGDSDTLMFRYNINDSLTNDTYGNAQGQVSPQALRTQLAKIDETHIFGPTLLNEFSIAVNRFYSNTASDPLNTVS